MSLNPLTYSFKDSSGALAHPLAVPPFFSFAGNIGMGQFTITMATERTVHDLSADGTIMPSYISGDNGSVDIEVQQTSILHAYLLSLYNTLKALADAGNVASWCSGTLTLRNSVDGSNHLLQGVSFSKIPDKVYAAQGQKLVWKLQATDIQNLTLTL
jgi:hypothetical protein